jgi:WD40 repeat protein
MRRQSTFWCLLVLFGASTWLGCGGGGAQPKAPQTTKRGAKAKTGETVVEPAPAEETDEPSTEEVAAGLPAKPQEEPAKEGSGQSYVGRLRAAIDIENTSDFVGWSPDGKYLLAGGRSCAVWSAETGQRVRELGVVSTALFHPDGQRVVTAGDDHIIVWNFVTGDKEKSIATDNSLAFMRISADGKRLLAYSDFFHGGIADLERGTWRLLDGMSMEISWRGGDISPDGQTLALSGKDGTFHLFDYATLERRKTIATGAKEVDELTFSPDGKWVATSGEGSEYASKQIAIWDAATGDKVSAYEKRDYISASLRFSPGGTMLAAVGSQLYVDAPLGMGTSASILDRGGWSVSDIAFSPDGKSLAAVTNKDDYVYIFDLERTREDKTIVVDDEWWSNRIIPLSDGNALIQRASRIPIVVNLMAKKKLFPVGEEEIDSGNPIAVSPDGATIILQNSNKLHWFNATDGSALRSLEGYFDGAVFAPDGKKAYAWGSDYSKDETEYLVYELDAATGENLRTLAPQRMPITSVAASRDGKRLATGGRDATVRILDLDSGDLVREALVHEGPVTGLFFSPDGRQLASVAAELDNVIGLWDLDQKQPQFLSGHQGNVLSAIFSSDSQTLVSVDTAGTIRVWDVARNSDPFALHAHNRGVGSCFHLLDESGFVTFSRDEDRAKVWKTDDLIAPPSPPRRIDLVRNKVHDTHDRKYLNYHGELAEFLADSSNTGHMAVSADEKRAATVGYDGQIFIWNLDRARAWASGNDAAGHEDIRTAFDNDTSAYQFGSRFVIARFDTGDGRDVQRLAFSPDGTKLLSASANEDGGRIAIWDTATGKQLKSFPGPKEFIDLGTSPRTSIVAIGSSDEDFVRLYNVADASELPTIPVGGKVASLAIDPTGNNLVVAADDKIQVFDLQSRQKTREQAYGSYGCEALAVSPDGRRLLILQSSLTGSQLQLFDFATGSPILESEKDDAIAEGAYFTRDGERLCFRAARNARWGVPMMFSAETGLLDRTLPQTYSELYFAQDGSTLVCADAGSHGVDLVWLPDAFDDDLQAKLGEWSRGIESSTRDGKYYVFRISVDGRITRELLGRLQELSVPMKLNLDPSSNLTDVDLKQLEGNSNVCGIALSSVYHERITAAGMRSLATLENLQELSIPHPDEELLAELVRLSKLQILQLGGTEAPAECYSVLAKLSDLRWVRVRLDGDQTVAALAVLAELPELTSLHLGGYGITPEHLMQLAKLRQLQVLNLDGISGMDEVAGTIAQLPNLRELSIRSYEFTNAGLAQLKNMEKLERLDLGDTRVEGAEELLDLKSLRWLHLPYGQKEQAKAFQKRRPDVMVVSG